MKGMTIIVKTIAGWVKILIFMFGIYVVLFGDITPGGGFAGGVILASSYILLMLAFGRESVEKNLPQALALKLLCCGVLAFAAIALSGLFFGADGFFWNYIYQEWLAGKDVEFIKAGIIPLAELAIGLAVAMSLFLVILNLSSFRSDISVDEKE